MWTTIPSRSNRAQEESVARFKPKPKPKPRKRRKMVRFRDRAKCRFCRENITYIDYKDTQTLQKLVTTRGKMLSRKRSGNCSAPRNVSKRSRASPRVWPGPASRSRPRPTNSDTCSGRSTSRTSPKRWRPKASRSRPSRSPWRRPSGRSTSSGCRSAWPRVSRRKWTSGLSRRNCRRSRRLRAFAALPVRGPGKNFLRCRPQTS